MDKLEKLLFEAVGADYDKVEGVVSASSILAPTKIRILEQRYADDLIEEPNSLDSRVYGTVIHRGIESFTEGAKDFIFEKRLFTEVDGVKISGKPDAYDMVAKVLYDYKTTSAYKFKNEEHTEFIEQMSIYKLLLNRNGFDVRECRIWGWTTDWNKRKSVQDLKYPKRRMIFIPLELLSEEETISLIKRKNVAYSSNLDVPDAKLPDCTDEELWKSEDTYAVFKKTASGGWGKRAHRVYKDVDNANDEAIKVNGKVELRKGEVIRCRPYCSVRNHCEQYKKLLLGGMLRDDY